MAPVIIKSLSRLSRDSLVNLCLTWTQSETSTPYLASNRKLLESEEEDYLHEPAENVTALKRLYENAKQQENGKKALSKRDIIDRIVDGDWRRGLSLQQLADVDFANLRENDTALRWSALKLVPLKLEEETESLYPAKKRKISYTKNHQQPHYPTISPTNFVANLKSHVSPLVKAHYTLHRLPSPSNLVILRLYIIPSTPFAPLSSNIPHNVRQATDAGRVMYIALPDSCSYVYVSLSGGTGSTLASKSKENGTASKTKIDIAATKRVVLESIPKALSKPQERWGLEATKLTCRSLNAIALLRGNGRPGTAGGCFSKFSEEYEWKPQPQMEQAPKQRETDIESQGGKVEHTPLTISQPHPTSAQLSAPPSSHELIVATRFGLMTTPSHAKLDRFHVTLSNLLSSPPTSIFQNQSQFESVSQPQTLPTSNSRPKRKRRSLEDIEAGRDYPTETAADITRPPTSKPDLKAEPAQITLNFAGTDVFRGLKELALFDNGKYVDLGRLPSWATGEKGVSGLVV